MGKLGTKDLSEAQRGRIIGLYEAGRSYRDIAAVVNVSIGTVSRWVKRHRDTGGVATLPRSGCPPVTTPAQNAAIIATVQQSGFTTAQKIRHNVGVACSDMTVCRRLRASGFNSCQPSKKPFLNDVSRQRRLEYAQRYVNWGEDEWSRTIFTDEKTFVSDQIGRSKVWRLTSTRYDESNVIFHHKTSRRTLSV